MPFLLFMPVKIGTFYNTSVRSPTVKNLYNEVSPMKEFLKGLYMVCHEDAFLFVTNCHINICGYVFSTFWLVIRLYDHTTTIK